MSEILLNAVRADMYAQLAVQDAVLKAVVMAHPFPLRIDQSLKEAFPKMLDSLLEAHPKGSPTQDTIDFAEIEVRRWLETLQVRLDALARSNAK